MLTNAFVISKLVLAERTSLQRLVQRIVGSAAAAEDVTQSLWLRVQRIADDPPIANKRAYLYRLASNLAIDHLKGEARQLEVHQEAGALLWSCDEALAAERVVIANDIPRTRAIKPTRTIARIGRVRSRPDWAIRSAAPCFMQRPVWLS
ncbi:MAG: sigma factor [Novosphingobium sp.]